MSARLISIDQMLAYVGDFGKFQVLIITLLCIINFSGSQVLIMYFAALSPPWKCAANSSVCLSNQTFSKDNNQRCSMNRSDWTFTEPKDYSVTTEFDLVCEKEWLISLTSAIFFIGWMIGGIFFGWLADSFGRKTVFFPSTMFLVVIGVVTSFSPNVIILLGLRFIAGLIVPGTFLQGFVIITEYTGSKYRPAAGCLYNIVFTVSFIQVGVIAYFIRTWKLLFILSNAPYALSIFFYPFIPESARWLLLHGKTKEVKIIFEKIAYMNDKLIPGDVVLEKYAKVARKSNPLELAKTKELAISTLVQGFGWMVNGMIFYGFSFAADDLGGSLYVNYWLINSVGLPTVFVVGYCCTKFGRKRTIISSLCLASAASIVAAFLHGKKGLVVAGITGTFFVNTSFNGIYIWSAELFPTSSRSVGMGFLQVAARVGSALAPFVVKELKLIHHTVPFITLGVLGSIAFLLLFNLPDTKNRQRRETFDDCRERNTTELENQTDIENKKGVMNNNFEGDTKL